MNIFWIDRYFMILLYDWNNKWLEFEKNKSRGYNTLVNVL